ncbi:hypothetical protein [Geotalea sp. SG265]|uniref:hypothetical protein n=1 Tax=Geotalea sp. SG265 TaxID=2922867 RepID=UPI001FAF29A7|nr:hypothetical protein [Geotalea sp. SG265]
MTLEQIFAHSWEELTIYHLDGTTYYLGVDVKNMVGVSNLSTAIARTSQNPRVSRGNWTMKYLPNINRGRAVYLLKYDGIIELIRNNKNRACRRLQPLLDT